MAESFELRIMKPEDIPEVLELMEANELEHASSLVLRLMRKDPVAVTVAVAPSGRVIGICCCIRTNENLCVLRSLCVDVDYRCQGVGSKLISWCLTRAGDGNLSVSCNLKRQNYYLKRGFRIVGNRWTFREFVAQHSLNLEDCVPNGVEIRAFQESHLQTVLDYALAVVGCADSTLKVDNSRADSFRTMVALQNGVCVGFGSVSLNFARTSTVEPIYADSTQIAEAILKRLIEDKPTVNRFAIGALNANRSMDELLKNFELEREDCAVRLYTKEIMEEDATKLFAMSFAI